MAGNQPNTDHTIIMGKTEQPMGGDHEAFLKAPKAKLVCLDDSLLDPIQKGLIIILDGAEKILGRDETNAAPLLYTKVSRKHARVYPADGKWGIEDLNSTNGVFVNDVRVTNSPLKTGDYVRIGAIPFRFVLERPDNFAMAPPSGGDDDSGKTMMFGALSGNAAGILMAADEEAEAEAAAAKVEAKVVAVDKPVFTSAGSYQAKPKNQGKNTKMIAAVVAFLLIGGSVFYLVTAKSGGKEETQAIQRQLKEYQANHEEASSPPASPEALAALNDLLAKSQEAVVAYPASGQLKELMAQALFFQLERHIAVNFKNNQAPQALRVVEAAKGELTKLKDPLAKGVDDVLNLAALAKEVAAIKSFRQRYPNPNEQAQTRPSPEEMNAYQSSRGNFMDLKRHPKTDELLKTRFMIFGRLVTIMDKEDLPFLDQWKIVVK